MRDLVGFIAYLGVLGELFLGLSCIVLLIVMVVYTFFYQRDFS